MKRAILHGVVPLLLCTTLIRAAIVANCDEPSLRAAIATGEPVIFACDGTIVLSNTIELVADLVLDARGRSVEINGTNKVRLFRVGGGTTFTLWNLTLANGFIQGTNASFFGRGGAISISGGGLEAYDCKFRRNVARGVDGLLAGDPLLANGGPAAGGAIGSVNSVMTLSNCVFEANTASGGAGAIPPPGSLFPGGYGGAAWGGAIDSTAFPITVIYCRFEGNRAVPGTQSGRLPVSAASVGGAISLGASGFTAIGSVWHSNSAGSAGGAIYSGVVSLDHCRFEGNAVGPGAPAMGGAIKGIFARISNCYFGDNSAQGAHGQRVGIGAIHGGAAEGGALWQDPHFGVDPLIANSTFVRNRAVGGEGVPGGLPGPPVAGSGFGGAIYTSGGRTGAVLNVENSTFAFNQASSGSVNALGRSGRGGAIFHGGQLLTIQFSTIGSNYVSDGLGTNSFGGGLATTNGPDTLMLRASIVAGNTANAAPQNASGPVTDEGVNLSSDGTPPFTFSNSRNNVDPRLRPFANNGGPTPTFALALDSPAIDYITDGSVIPTDQRGVPRPQGRLLDAGAYEQTFVRVFRAQNSTLRIEYTGVPHAPYILQRRTDENEEWFLVGFNDANAQGLVTFPHQTTADAWWSIYRVAPFEP